MRGEQAIFNLEIKKKSGLSNNPDIHHSKVFSSGFSIIFAYFGLKAWKLNNVIWDALFLFFFNMIEYVLDIGARN